MRRLAWGKMPKANGGMVARSMRGVEVLGFGGEIRQTPEVNGRSGCAEHARD